MTGWGRSLRGVSARLAVIGGMFLLCAQAQAAQSLVCTVERAIVDLNGSVVARVVALDESNNAVKLLAVEWTSEHGTMDPVAGDPSTAKWTVTKAGPLANVERAGEAFAQARVPAAGAGGGSAACKVRVIVRKGAVAQNMGQQQLQGARSFFLQSSDPLRKDYGLYSYLLMARPPADAERNLYLAVIQSLLRRIEDLSELEARNAPRPTLNLTLIPVKLRPKAVPPGESLPYKEIAEDILAKYDHGFAKEAITKIFGPGNSSGIYLVSLRQPLGNSAVSSRLVMDFRPMTRNVVDRAMESFERLSATEHAWSEEKLERLALNVRVFVAVGGDITQEVLKALADAIKVWK